MQQNERKAEEAKMGEEMRGERAGGKDGHRGDGRALAENGRKKWASYQRARSIRAPGQRSLCARLCGCFIFAPVVLSRMQFCDRIFQLKVPQTRGRFVVFTSQE